MLTEFGKQRVFLGRCEVVACRVGNHRHAASLADPAHGVAQACPAVRHKTGFAFGEKAAEHFRGVVAYALLYQIARKVGARDQLWIACVAQRALVGTGNARQRELLCHVLCSCAATASCLLQAVGKGSIMEIET